MMFPGGIVFLVDSTCDFLCFCSLVMFTHYSVSLGSMDHEEPIL